MLLTARSGSIINPSVHMTTTNETNQVWQALSTCLSVSELMDRGRWKKLILWSSGTGYSDYFTRL